MENDEHQTMKYFARSPESENNEDSRRRSGRDRMRHSVAICIFVKSLCALKELINGVISDQGQAFIVPLTSSNIQTVVTVG